MRRIISIRLSSGLLPTGTLYHLPRRMLRDVRYRHSAWFGTDIMHVEFGATSYCVVTCGTTVPGFPRQTLTSTSHFLQSGAISVQSLPTLPKSTPRIQVPSTNCTVLCTGVLTFVGDTQCCCMVLRISYALSGSEISYGAMVGGGSIAASGTECCPPTRTIRDVRYSPSVWCYAP
eukprot:2111125-Rhodomonas_salina.7